MQTMSYDTLHRNYWKTVKQLDKAQRLLKTLIENCPDTYSGTDVMKQQNKMFKFQNAVNESEDFLKEIGGK